MCVNTHTLKCCCGSCSLTTATIVLGILNLLGTVAYGVSMNWYSFGISLVITLLYLMVVVKPYDVYTRKILYYTVMITGAIGVAVLAIVGIVLWVTFDDWVEDACKNNTHNSNDYWNCMDYAKAWFVTGFIVALAFSIFMFFISWQILFYGWKEQEQLN